MIRLPDFKKSYEYENNFYLSCDLTRIPKILAHYELFKKALDVPGAIVECGVFKGVSLTRFAMFREIFAHALAKKIVAFDTFGKFPAAGFKEDGLFRRRLLKSHGQESISRQQLMGVLKHKGIHKEVELVGGDIVKTVPHYLKRNPGLKISLLNLDTDLYEPAVAILEHLYPRITNGGILLLDDYGIFPGETKAVDDYFKGKDIKIQKLPFAVTPSFIIKKP